jgi:hypothetical protein
MQTETAEQALAYLDLKDQLTPEQLQLLRLLKIAWEEDPLYFIVTTEEWRHIRFYKWLYEHGRLGS